MHPQSSFCSHPLLSAAKATGSLSALFSHNLSPALKIPILTGISSANMCYSAHCMLIKESLWCLLFLLDYMLFKGRFYISLVPFLYPWQLPQYLAQQVYWTWWNIANIEHGFCPRSSRGGEGGKGEGEREWERGRLIQLWTCRCK